MCVKGTSIAADKRVGPDCGRGGYSGREPAQPRRKDTLVALMMEEKYDDLAELRERAKAEVS